MAENGEKEEEVQGMKKKGGEAKMIDDMWKKGR